MIYLLLALNNNIFIRNFILLYFCLYGYFEKMHQKRCNFLKVIVFGQYFVIYSISKLEMSNRFIIMNTIAIICLILVLAAAAPSADKMKSVPVSFRLFRATLQIITLVCTVAILLLQMLVDPFIMSSSSLSMELAITIQ